MLGISENLNAVVTTWPKMDKNTVFGPQLCLIIKNRIFCQCKRFIKTVLSIPQMSSSKGQRPSSQHTKYGQNYSFGSITAFRYTRWQLLPMEGRLTAAVLSISENLRSKGQMPRSANDQKWTKMLSWSYIILLMYRILIFMPPPLGGGGIMFSGFLSNWVWKSTVG